MRTGTKLALVVHPQPQKQTAWQMPRVGWAGPEGLPGRAVAQGHHSPGTDSPQHLLEPKSGSCSHSCLGRDSALGEFTLIFTEETEALGEQGNPKEWGRQG